VAVSIPEIRQRLHDQDFPSLFIEHLGWDRVPATDIAISTDGKEHHLRPIAQKRDVVVCSFNDVPDRVVRARMERALAKVHFEHVIVFMDAETGDQVWQWAKRDPGRPVALREHWLRAGQTGEALAERLAGLSVSLDEEAELTLPGVTTRLRRTFDADRITRAFYDRFKAEHQVFLSFISGIQAQGDREWYASLMLNRLMFVYFMQKKGFLDTDIDYLRNRLKTTQSRKGRDNFHSFYRHFLLRLFQEGLGTNSRTTELDELLGRVPYLNGGLFDVHELERAYDSIEIADEAFETIFDFFDQYNWHLDERPLRADNEINPDVLGYIFEKYVNQKQMGAYYTKEDITGYISKNTVVPFLLDNVRTEYSTAFDASASSVWNLLKEDPDRYIYPALRHGADLPLPDAVVAGVNPPSIDSAVTAAAVQTIELRRGWNRSAPEEVALPSETWREVIARRQRCNDLRNTLASGEVREISDLISLNIDLLQFAHDIIANCEQPELLRAVWKAINKVTILDPACGSGAFLFAALNILEPLYDACLERMESFLMDERGSGKDGFADFRSLLDRVARHANRRYFVCKQIILNNLFGVDIMKEAVEICKLRLFLKLASQVEPNTSHPNMGIEPLPDIDFNIRPGNTLVGFASYSEASEAIASKLDFDNSMARISTKASNLQAAFDTFRVLQVDGDGAAAAAEKPDLRNQLAGLQEELNRYLAVGYGVDADEPSAYSTWLASHQPFHWFVEFYGIMSQGGFDVIIGNPPYVEYSQVSALYTIQNPETRALGNLHAMITRRALSLLSHDGGMSMIVPVALPSTDRFEGLRREILSGRDVWVSHYDFRPAKLFEGAEQRLTIFILRPGENGVLNSTRYNRWYGSQRQFLFPCLAYSSSVGVRPLRTVWPKLDGHVSVSVLEKITAQPLEVTSMIGSGSPARLYYKNTGILYHTTFTRQAPECFINGKRSPSSRETALKLRLPEAQFALHCLLNSSVFFVTYELHSNCRDLNPSDIQTFRMPPNLTEESLLQKLSNELHDNQQSNSQFRVRNQKQTGEVRLQSFSPALSKPVLDKIDHVLAQHYGFTERELDFIVNYDIKYRLGSEDEGDGT
jgi:hypothetical protein